MKALYNRLATALEQRFNFDARYFMRGGFWLTVGQVVIVGLGLITTALFAHVLTEAEYGIYRYIIGLAVIFSTFSLTGLGQAILQTAAKKWYGFYNETLRINFLYSLPIAFLAGGGAVYYWHNENLTLALGCLLIAIIQPISSTFQYIPTFLQGNGQFKESTIVHTMKSVISSLISLGALFFTHDILWLMAAYLGSQAITNIISHLWYRPHTLTKTPREEFSKYLSYAKHTSVRGFLLNAAFRVDGVIVFTQLGAVELAVYTIASVIPEQVKGSFKSLSTLLLPKYAAHADFSAVRKSIPYRSVQLFVVLTGVAILYGVCAPFIYTVLFPKYEAAIFLSQLLALSFPAMVALIPMNAIESQLQEKDLYILHTVSAIIMLICTVAGILLYGLVGAIMAKVIYRYLVLGIAYMMVSRQTT
jgi:O-antigen/teichoic acid export membrane protein